MDIKYFATFRDLTGENERRLDVTPATLQELLELLSARYGTVFRRAVFNGAELTEFAIILVNGRNVRLGAGLATALHQDDLVAIFPMVAGG